MGWKENVLTISKVRFSKEEITHILAFCVIPTYTWTLINMFQDVPAWSMSLSSWDMIGTVAYTLTSVLVETLVIFFLFMGIGYILPKKWVGDRYVAIVGLVMLEATILAIIAHHYIREGIARDLIPFILVFLVVLVITLILVWKFPSISFTINRIAVPLTTLAFVYLSLSVIGVAFILIRNI